MILRYTGSGLQKSVRMDSVWDGYDHILRMKESWTTNQEKAKLSRDLGGSIDVTGMLGTASNESLQV